MYRIECRHLHKEFRTDRGPIIPAADLTVSFPAGEISSVVGESGCGKTTLIRMIAGLEAPDSGEVVFTDEHGRPGRPRIGIVFQEPRLFPWMSTRENVALAVRKLPAPEREKRVDEVLRLVGLGEAAGLYPSELSGGMAQRAGLARALAALPDVLLLDEAFGALDALTRHRLHDEFVRIHASHPLTAVLITHDVAEAVILSRTIVELRHGKVAEAFEAPFPYPRTLGSPGVGELTDRIFSTFFNQHQPSES